MQNTQPTPTVIDRVRHSAGNLRAALDLNVTSLTAPDLYELISETRPLAQHLEVLTTRVTTQLRARHQLGGLRHDQPDGTVDEETQAAYEALDEAAHWLRAVNACLEDAHASLSHLADDPQRETT